MEQSSFLLFCPVYIVFLLCKCQFSIRWWKSEVGWVSFKSCLCWIAITAGSKPWNQSCHLRFQRQLLPSSSKLHFPCYLFLLFLWDLYFLPYWPILPCPSNAMSRDQSAYAGKHRDKSCLEQAKFILQCGDCSMSHLNAFLNTISC